MPELPEVETVVRDLKEAGLGGRSILKAAVHWARIEAVSRRGKFIVISLSTGQVLLIHLRMTGKLSFAPTGTHRSKHQHVILALDDGRELRFEDTRKFGRWYLLDDAQTRLGNLGPEPLEAGFTARSLTAILSRHARMLKPLLLDQQVIAGLGNIYVDEALWDAALHPCRLSNSVSVDDAARLRRAIRKVLRRGVRAMGTSLGNASTNFYSVAGRRGRNKDGLRVFRRVGEPCPRCRTPIERLVVAQRSSHVCPSCQEG